MNKKENHFPGISVISKYEKNLQTEEEKYHSFFDKNPIPQWIYEEETFAIVEVNEAAINKYGYTKKEFINLTIFDLRPKEDIENLQELLKAPFAERQKHIKNKPFRHITKDGKIVDVEVLANFYKHQNGKNLIFLSAIDITERLSYQNELKASEERFKRLNSATVEGVVIHDNGKIKEANDAFCKIIGYSMDEIIGKDPMVFAHPDSKEIIKQNMINNTEEPYEAIGIRKDGKPVYVEMQGKQIVFNNNICRVVTFRDLTERKKIEKELEHSQKKFKMLADNSSDIIFRYSFFPEYKLDYISPSIENITGYKLSNFYNDPYFGYSIIHPDDKQKAAKTEDIIRKNKTRIKNIEVKRYVIRWITTSGETIWIETVNNPIYENGKLIAVEGISRNITERVLTEQQNQRLNDSYKTLIDNSPFGILITDKDTKVIYANKEGLKIFGYKQMNALVGKTVLDNIPEKDHQTIKDRVLKVLKGKEVGFLETEYVRNDGVKKFLETKPIPVIFNGVSAVQVVVNDITEKKEYEREQLRTRLAEQSNKILQKEIFERIKVEQELKKAQLYLQSMISSSLDMIAAADQNGKIIEFNTAAQKTFGYTLEEVKGKSFDFLFANKSDKKQVSFPLEKTKTIFQGEVLNKKKNGETFVSYLSASPLTNEKGEVIGSMGVSRDITEIKRKEEQLRIQTAKLNAIFESGSYFVWTVNKKMEVTSINNNLKSFLKGLFNYVVDPKKNNQNLPTFYKYLHNKRYIEFWKANFNRALRGEQLQFEIKYYDKKGKKNWREVFLYPIYDEKDKIFEVSCMAHDITEKKQAETVVQEKTAKLNAIFESSTHYIWTVNKALQLTSFNKNYYSFALKNYGVRIENGNTSLRTLTNGDNKREKFWKEKYRLAFKGIPQFFETSFNDKFKNIIWREVFLHPINTNSSEIMEVSAISHDITEKKKIEQETNLKTAKLNAVINSSTHLIYTVNSKNQLTSFNENYAGTIKSHFGVRPVLGTSLSKEGALKKEDVQYELWKHNHKQALTGKKIVYESTMTNKKGDVFYYENHLSPIILPNSSIEEVSYITQDITDKKIAEREIKSSLKEKEVLLQEVHHRVKNNLQVISSILNLQSSYIKDPNTLSLLLESQNRIKSMSFIHEILYQTKDFSNINFKEYILSIVNNLSHSYRTNNNVSFMYDIDNIYLHLDTSIPCGLMVNELISNALKYAFPDGRKGKITVRIKKKNSKIELEVSDNGVGFPKKIDFRNTNSLGLQLVNSLTDQVNGKITLNNTGGTKFLITFNQ